MELSAISASALAALARSECKDEISKGVVLKFELLGEAVQVFFVVKEPHFPLELVPLYKENELGNLLRRKRLPHLIKHIIQNLSLLLDVCSEFDQIIR